MKNTMIFKAAVATVAALGFSGCAAITGYLGGESGWRTYMKNDASI